MKLKLVRGTRMTFRKFRTYACDFETTVYDNQSFTEVWSACFGELNKDNVEIMPSISDFFNYFFRLKDNVKLYFHNLAFDGSFILSYFIKDLKFSQAYDVLTSDGSVVRWKETKDMKNGEIKYSISDVGQWYYIIIKKNNKIIEIRDSLKLLPFSLEEIGDSFNTKHKKLSMNYKGVRYAGCSITDEEKEYIKNDVYVLKEALEIMFGAGHDKLTIGACCVSEYVDLLTKPYIERLYPDLTKFHVGVPVGFKDADEYIRKSYKGGWCYLKKGCENKVYKNGITADVNSLYPSVMHSDSNNFYPVGEPVFWKGNYIPEQATEKNKYYFIRIKTRFYLKKDKLPCIQIKNTFKYHSNEWLESSDFFDKVTNKYYDTYLNLRGEKCKTQVTMTLTQTDYQLIQEQYNLIDFEILDGCYFTAKKGIFDEYICKYKKLKMNSTGAQRTLAKLYLNNLYGKLASGSDSSFKVAYIKNDESLGFYSVMEDNKKTFFIAVGSAITSYARNFTIKAAQANYNTFIYADTDSIHCICEYDKLKNIKIHPNEFLCWKIESSWDIGKFIRQKTYVEHIIKKDLKDVKPEYDIKCAGMPQRCKQLFLASMGEGEPPDELNDESIEFLKVHRSLNDFCYGLEVPLKLRPKRIKGGVILVDTMFTLR